MAFCYCEHFSLFLLLFTSINDNNYYSLEINLWPAQYTHKKNFIIYYLKDNLIKIRSKIVYGKIILTTAVLKQSQLFNHSIHNTTSVTPNLYFNSQRTIDMLP